MTSTKLGFILSCIKLFISSIFKDINGFCEICWIGSNPPYYSLLGFTITVICIICSLWFLLPWAEWELLKISEWYCFWMVGWVLSKYDNCVFTKRPWRLGDVSNLWFWIFVWMVPKWLSTRCCFLEWGYSFPRYIILQKVWLHQKWRHFAVNPVFLNSPFSLIDSVFLLLVEWYWPSFHALGSITLAPGALQIGLLLFFTLGIKDPEGFGKKLM